jgi:predicted nucleic acid-binding Zn ribbon protein
MSQSVILQCPGCREYISSDARECRFCHMPMDAKVVAQAAEELARKNRSERKRTALRHMLIGLGIFALGLAITIGTYSLAASSESGGHYVITYGLIISGAGDFIYGGWLWLSELK